MRKIFIPQSCRKSTWTITDKAGTKLNISSFHNVTWTREPGEEPGTYAILSMKADECDNITVTPSEYAKFTIKKGTVHFGMKTVQTKADGVQRKVNLASIYGLKDAKVPASCKIGELKEEDKARFSVLPKAEGNTISFALKPTTESYNIELPIEMEGKCYTYTATSGGGGLIISTSSSAGVEVRTEAEIREFVKNHPFNTSFRDAWTTAPDITKKLPEFLPQKRDKML